MDLLANLNDQVGKLVHPTVQANPVELARQSVFVATRLGLALGAMIIAPLCLLGHAPAWWEVGALGWLLLPCAAVAYVSRTGDLILGEAVSLAAWIGLALTVAAGTGSGLGLGLLLLVPLEAAVAFGSVYVTAALAMAVAAAVFLAVATTLNLTFYPDPHLGSFGTGIIAAAVGYGAVLAVMAARLQSLQQHHHWLGQERYRVLSEAIDDVVFRFDGSGMVQFSSSAADHLFGINPRELLGRGFFEHIHVADRPTFLKLVTDVASGGESRACSLRVRTGNTVSSDKGEFEEPVFAWVELRARRYDHADSGRGGSRSTGVVALMRDITAHKLHEKVVEDAKRTTERNNAGRDLFLANVSHELRTPLNAIIGFAEMLASEELAPRDAAKQREYATIIHHSGQHLLAVVNSILDASKIESGSFDIVPESFDIGSLIHLCCDMVGLKAEQAGIRLERDVVPSLQDVVGDKRACKQIVLNLLSNALKFTLPDGKVTVGARPEGTSVLLYVADTGIGIGPRDLPRLGDPFFQARGSYDRPYDGTGLGLSVVRGLVGLHGGTISIESGQGQGTRVTVRLPLDCRRGVQGPTSVTKIETIPRYPSSLQPAAGPPDLARVHKIA